MKDMFEPLHNFILSMISDYLTERGVGFDFTNPVCRLISHRYRDRFRDLIETEVLEIMKHRQIISGQKGKEAK